jgi:hypothetical protein
MPKPEPQTPQKVHPSKVQIEESAQIADANSESVGSQDSDEESEESE